MMAFIGTPHDYLDLTAVVQDWKTEGLTRSEASRELLRIAWCYELTVPISDLKRLVGEVYRAH